MELTDGVLTIGSFLAFTLGLIVLFVGKRINESVGLLREFSIPEPVTGGLLFSVVIALIYAATGIAIDFELNARDVLLVYFFTTIGINASIKDLVAGGKPLLILLGVTIAFMLAQNLVGITVARLFDLSAATGVLGGSVSLIGGHGTAIAWAPRIAEDYGVASAMEIGIACATFGLILASVMGGPIAKLLIDRHGLTPVRAAPLDVGVEDKSKHSAITALQFMDSILAIHLCILIGLGLNALLKSLGLDLPLFVTCLFAGIVMTNLVPRTVPRITGMTWPTRTPTMALIAEVSLGAFLAMSLMSMQLWTLLEMAGPILSILAMQSVLVAVVSIFVVFRVMGKNYDAAVISAGFAGFTMGATPTAMANMSAVTSRYGASHLAFIIVPLVCAFFIDLANALMIPVFLNHF